MTLLDGDRPTSDPAVEEAEALIEEARHRQRRRWQWIAGMLAILVAVGAVVAFSVKGRDHPGRTSSPSNSVVPALSRSSVRGLPAEIVAAVYLTSPKIPITSRPEAGTEIDVVSTRTGRVLRVLAHGWVAVIAHVGRKVFFLQIPCERSQSAVSRLQARTVGTSPTSRMTPRRTLHALSYWTSLPARQRRSLCCRASTRGWPGSPGCRPETASPCSPTPTRSMKSQRSS